MEEDDGRAALQANGMLVSRCALLLSRSYLCPNPRVLSSSELQLLSRSCWNQSSPLSSLDVHMSFLFLLSCTPSVMSSP